MLVSYKEGSCAVDSFELNPYFLPVIFCEVDAFWPAQLGGRSSSYCLCLHRHILLTRLPTIRQRPDEVFLS
jgi:hypothetical protein